MNSIQTSTPVLFPKPSSQSSKNSWVNQSITQQLYRNTWNKFKSPDKSTYWDSIESPNLVDFNQEPTAICDTFFDGKQPDCPSPQEKREMMLPKCDEATEIIRCFSACSISTITNSSIELEDETLLGEDTLRGEDALRAAEATQDNSKSDRRQSHIVVKPFSFELREKENQERRESRRAYYKMLTEKMTTTSFKAKPAPKFIQRLSFSGKSELIDETPHRRVIRVPRGETAEPNASKASQKIEKAKNIIQVQKSMKCTMNPPQLEKAKSAVNTVHSRGEGKAQFRKTKDPGSGVAAAKGGKPSESAEERSTASIFQIKKQKPFQVTLPKRKLEMPKSPHLLTAKRARERQQFEEKIKERERQKEEMRKKEAAAQRAKEQEEIARLRKMTVFKARPVPQFKKPLNPVTKRPLTEGMMPIFTKRRRCL